MERINEYQDSATLFRVKEASNLPYLALGLCGEAGEVAEQIKKALRNDEGRITAKRQEALILELGDVLWYAANIADWLGVNLSEVLEMNINKLIDRQKRDNIRHE